LEINGNYVVFYNTVVSRRTNHLEQTLSQPLQIEIELFVDTCAPDSGATQFRFSCPSTQLAIRVPHLGLHFSPARYSRVMLILHALEGVNQLEEGLDAEKKTTMPVQWQHGTTLGRLRFYLGGVCLFS
jgi:hypothetical protein